MTTMSRPIEFATVTTSINELTRGMWAAIKPMLDSLSDEEIEKFIDWLAKPNIFLDEGHLQKMYNYKEGSAWDFLLHALGKKKIPTPKERIEKSYLSYIHTYNFTDEQIIVLKKIKDVFTSNVASQKNIDEKEIFGNPVYERLIGSYESINKLFEGKFNE